MPKTRSGVKKTPPKVMMTFEVSTLNVLLRYAMCTGISKSSVVNLGKLMAEVDLFQYNYAPDVYVRIKAIQYVCEARVSYGMTDPDVIKSYIISSHPDGEDVLKEIPPLEKDTLGFNECTGIAKIVSERLQTLYIYRYKDEIINHLNEFAKGGWTSYADTVEALRTELQDLLSNLTSSAHNRSQLIRKLNLAAPNCADLVDIIVQKSKIPSSLLATGIRQLNAILGPAFQGGRLYLFLGLTGRFKSGTLLNIADMITKYNPQVTAVVDGMRNTVLFITNENSVEETFARLLDMYSGVDDDIMKMSTEDALRFIRENGGFTFTDNDGITIEFQYYLNMEISTADIYVIINQLADEGFRVIALILDYIARVKAVEGNQEERLRLANVAKELKSIANFYSIPVITAQQVNREGNGIIDAAMRDNKADLAKFLGTTAVAESYGLIFEADWVCLVNLEKRRSDNRWFLTFNRLKMRGKQDPFAVTYFNHPFVDTKRIRLQPDVDLPQSVSVVSLASDLISIPQEEEQDLNVANNPKKFMSTNALVQRQNGSNLLSNIDLNGVVMSS